MTGTPPVDELDALSLVDPLRTSTIDPVDVEAALAAWRDRNDLPVPDAVDALGPNRGDDWAIREPTPGRRRSQRRRLITGGALFATAAVAAVAVPLTVHRDPPSAHQTAPGAVTVEALAPLLTGADIDCAGVQVPVSALAAPAGAETEPGIAGDALRHFFDHNPWQGMSNPPRTGWALLARTPSQLVFGLRTGAFGVSDALRLDEQPTGFVATQLGACSRITLSGGDSTSTVTAVSAVGTQLTVSWVTSYSDCGSPFRLREVEVVERPTTVHLLAVVVPSAPRAQQSDTPFIACIAPPSAPSTATATVTLDAPIGSRTVVDDGTVPPAAVPVS